MVNPNSKSSVLIQKDAIKNLEEFTVSVSESYPREL